ncbi:alpha/beta hydrolase family protein [Flavobacterium sp. AG291]|uniref:alpha/beta hydrolase family protein n=1 Tax=Flavobacterium sp. AG291 TaxID=2184000 RepID=UPI000E2D4C34|nr:prolyl oligopeptidase family serine peptidase [Flavobacterium sp. AG291]RDI11243.1 prolyl oligopeptidase family protein [Flavobacterium sp. AG291]
MSYNTKHMILAVWLCFVFSFVRAQDKLDLTENDYDKWHSLAFETPSADGKWVVYSLKYRDRRDTLFLAGTENGKLLQIPGGHSAKFTGDSKWFMYIVNDTLKVKGLKLQADYTIAGIENYILKGNKMIGSHTKTLTISAIGSLPDKITVQDVKEFAVNDKGDRIVLIRETADKSTVELHEPMPGANAQVLLEDAALSFGHITWNKGGTAFLVSGNSKESSSSETKLYFYSLTNKTGVKKMPTAPLQDKGSIVAEGMDISDDGTKVFFDLETFDSLKVDVPGLTVFKDSDQTIPPLKAKKKFWHLWDLESDTVRAVENLEYPTAMPNADYTHALVYTHRDYYPLHDYAGYYMDLAILDFSTGVRKKIVDRQLYGYQQVVLSAYGKIVAYFKDSQWWLYTIKNGKHRSIKTTLTEPFLDAENDYPNPVPYGIGGWTGNDQYVLLYDKYDIWLINTESGAKKRITAGREKNTVYRLYGDRVFPTIHSGFGFTSKEYDLERGFFIIGLKNEDYGYQISRYSKKSGWRIITEGNGSVSSLKKAEKSNDIFFIESAFDSPPKLMHVKGSGLKYTVLQSNPHHYKYKWGKAKLISYDACGKNGLKAALFFPAGYDPEKSYPMIVNIYQDKSKELHRYVAPSLRIYDGFNTANFTTNGYFVLMPDIHFIMDQPGKSALECVIAAAKAAIENANINTGRIALIGHSFGGFETSYIISQTDFFRTGVSGAGISDLMNFYLDIDPYQKSNMERFDNGQYRNSQLFNTARFSAESPLYNVNSVNTPLLLWAGTNDRLVPFSNSIRLHSALWRLGKKSTLLLYDAEGHVIESKDNQSDLYHKILDWFAYYLKDGVKPAWME